MLLYISKSVFGGISLLKHKCVATFIKFRSKIHHRIVYHNSQCHLVLSTFHIAIKLLFGACMGHAVAYLRFDFVCV